VGHGSDPHTYKKSRPKVSPFERKVETDGQIDGWTNEQMDGGDCITSCVNTVSNHLNIPQKR